MLHFTLLHFYLSKSIVFSPPAPQNVWLSPLRQNGPLHRMSQQACWTPSLPFCSRHMFSQALCIEVCRVGTTYIPHPLVDLCELSLCWFLCVTLAVRSGCPPSSRGGQTQSGQPLAKINSDGSFMWKPSDFTNFFTANTAWGLCTEGCQVTVDQCSLLYSTEYNVILIFFSHFMAFACK